VNLPDRGRPVLFGPVNWWRKRRLAHSSRSKLAVHEQAAVGLRCRCLLEFLKLSDPVGHLRRPYDGLDVTCVLAHRPSAKSGTPPSSPARHATAAHTSSSSTRLMLGSAAFTLAMRALTPPRVRLELAAWRELSSTIVTTQIWRRTFWFLPQFLCNMVPNAVVKQVRVLS
jgi:hypothetical protein